MKTKNAQRSSPNYQSLLQELDALLTGRWLTDFSNFSAFIMSEVDELNWVGFYLLNGETLYLGPFQGKPACTEIRLGRGVCGHSALHKKTLVVDDVHQFDDHIVCDSASESEMVIPLIQNGKLFGVLDVDSPVKARFGEDLQDFLSQSAEMLMNKQKRPLSAAGLFVDNSITPVSSQN